VKVCEHYSKMDIYDIEVENNPAIVVQGNVPAFLLKLWKIVEDPQCNELIAWNQDGRTIKIFDQNEFSKQILPRYYKHNNISSFVRQINMYGFRKIVDNVNGGLKQDNVQQWEFFHRYFQQGKPDQLHLIKRKVHLKEESKVSTPQLSQLLEDVERLKNQHDSVDDRLNLVRAENELLWREVSDLRDQHKSQQAIIQKLIQFFVKLIMGKPTEMARKRRALDYPLVGGSKMARVTQDLQLYDPQTASLSQQLYDPQTAPLPQFSQEPPAVAASFMTDQESRGEDERLIELPSDTVLIENNDNNLMNQEENLTSSSLEELIATSSMSTDTTNQYTLTFPQTPTTSLPQAYSQDQSSMQVQPISQQQPIVQQQPISQQQILLQQSQPQILPQQSQPLLMLQPEQSSQSHTQPLPPQPIITTVTIIPSAKKSKAKTSSTTNVYTSKSPKYKPIRPKITVTKPSLVPATTTLPASSFIFPNTFDINAKNRTIKKEPLTTPVLAAPESIAVVDSYPSNDDMCRQVVCDMLPKDACRQICDLQSANAEIPIVTAPVSLQRQRSFRDRKEISSDVEQISKSIDMLQEMLDKKQINLDIKHLNINQFVNDLPTQITVQDLIRLSQQKDHDDTTTETLEEGGQVLPYSEPFSPSQLMDEDYGSTTQNNRSEFFDSVLNNEQNINLDALLD